MKSNKQLLYLQSYSFSLLEDLESFAQTRTTRIVPRDPNTIEPTGPKSSAVAPDSNSPSSFEAPIKIAFTEDTRFASNLVFQAVLMSSQ